MAERMVHSVAAECGRFGLPAVEVTRRLSVRIDWLGNMNVQKPFWLTAGLAGLLTPSCLLAHEPETIEKVVVTGRADSLLTIADAASEGYVGQDHLEYRPMQRPGELLETIPGVIVTQHSGDGKANQYFSRGFNLDHGTDFATSVDGMPVNLPTHAHGQGYTDLNFVIPELIQTIHYRKGPYYAEVGDFGSAGAADISYVESMPQNLASFEGGSFGYYRGLYAGSSPAAGGNLLYGAELGHNDGPWANGEDSKKVNGIARFSKEKDGTGFTLTAMGYAAGWDATDQVARRAIDTLPGGRYGAIDPSDGGSTHRGSLSMNWHRESDAGHTEVELYGIFYDLKLYSNFTYYLNDPVHGDQIEQHDERGIGGLTAHHTWNYDVLGFASESTVGMQIRGDYIENGLDQTEQRQYLSTTRLDTVVQVSVSPYAEQKTHWNEWLRSTVGLRADLYTFDVADLRPENTGSRSSILASPKGTLIFGPWNSTEFYLGGGLGFHSNDGRGAVTHVDPKDPSIKLDPVDPLVRTYGAEVGVRTVAIPHWQSSVALWWLDIDSELVFAGDAGDTSVNPPSRRVGIEFSNYYTPTKWVTLDTDLSLSRARFRDTVIDNGFATHIFTGRYIPGSVETTLTGGISLHDPNPDRGFFSSLRARYFGPRALVEDNTVRSGATLMVNAQAGYRFNKTWTLSVDVFNLLGRHDADIDYYYASALKGDPAGGIDDIHTHPVEPLSARVTLAARF